MDVRDNRRTLWLFPTGMELMSYSQTEKVEKRLLFA